MANPFTLVPLLTSIASPQPVNGSAGSPGASEDASGVQGQPSLSAGTSASARSTAGSFFGRVASPSFGGDASLQKDSGPRWNIESLDAWDQNVFVGTSDGHVAHYYVDQPPLGQSFKWRLGARRNLGLGRKPVEQILALPAELTVLALCDSTLSFLDINTLGPVSAPNFESVRGVLNIATSSTSPSVPQGSELGIDRATVVTLGKRRSIQRWEVGKGGMLTEFPLSDGPPLTMRQRSSTLCLADTSNYRLVDLSSGRQSVLLPFDRSLAPRPLVAVVNNDEFIIATSTALGVFLSGRGDATRGTLQWSSYPKAIACHFPYTLALLPNNTIQIHSVITQSVVQNLPLPTLQDPRAFSSASIDTPSLRSLANYEPIEVALFGADWASAVCMTRIEDQVETLFLAGDAESAVVLAEATYETAKTAKLPYPENLHSVYRKAGCALFSDILFEESLTLFKKGILDPAVLILIFPDLAALAAGDGFQLSEASLEVLGWLGSIDEIVEQHLQKNYPDADSDIRNSFSVALVSNARETLIKYLVHCRENVPPFAPDLDDPRKRMVDTALMEGYAENDGDALLALLESGVACDEETVIPILKGKNRWYALARYFQSKTRAKEALDLLEKLADGNLKDKDYPGLQCIIEILSATSDDEVLWKHASWVLLRDPALGVEIFTSATERNRAVDKEDVLRRLSSISKKAKRLYLEWLIHESGLEESQYHTDLAIIYFEDVTSAATTHERLKELDEVFTASSLVIRQSFLSFLSKREDLLSKERLAFISFLTSSRFYQAPILLARMLQFGGFSVERAVVYSKTGEHEKALKIFAQELKDFVGAEEYCINASSETVPETEHEQENSDRALESNLKRSKNLRNALLLTLIRLYLKSTDRDSLAGEVVRLLNGSGSTIELHEVLPLIPDQWSLTLLQPFLLRAMRRNYHDRTEGKIIYQLAKLENLKITGRLFHSMKEREPMVLSRATACAGCSTRITEPFFVSLPNGTAVHLKCLYTEEATDK
ncbi:hypothetical protein M427DRAFT_152188 [Gonapodya prolifera JEL478]|uniref:CNH domain-containing protein n=1 Tax=Gonapodya prolifera (strain JEL478) TaxID=1344416 RepID=A0A139ASE8_GONPJ|nr:hypothetical protein M427DRAFT_152188 [Gonapodya prolifera JEL478]|eukprot:KXS19661.1 hypothetical protein M427DRAFT_152188 [Gonapodya prolifera JEL478]